MGASNKDVSRLLLETGEKNEAGPDFYLLLSDERDGVAHRSDGLPERTDGGIDVSQQFVAQRYVLADTFFELLHLNVRIIELCDQTDGCQPIHRQPASL